jgi:hypothetical protein
MTQVAKDGNIVFFENDNPQAGESLRRALAKTGEAPLLGLILKVEEERVVNWMFADTSLIKSLALILPGGKKRKTRNTP